MSDVIQYLIIHGTTLDGQRFRPSDWTDRLAGVLSRIRPDGVMATGPLSYSPYATPCMIDGVHCIRIDPRIRAIEPLAWKFVCDFAQSNRLRTSQDPIAQPSATSTGESANPA